jgi:hypothetical protein
VYHTSPPKSSLEIKSPEANSPLRPTSLSISSWRVWSLATAVIHGVESCGVTVMLKSSGGPMMNGAVDRLVCGTAYPASRTRHSSHEALSDWRWLRRSSVTESPRQPR